MLEQAHRRLRGTARLISIFVCLVSPAYSQNQVVTIQVAAVLTQADAQALTDSLRAKGLEAYWVKAQVPGKGTRYRIRIGRFNTTGEAQAGAERVCGQASITQFIIVSGEVMPPGAPNSCRALSAQARPAPLSPVHPATNPPVKPPASLNPPLIAGTQKSAEPRPQPVNRQSVNSQKAIVEHPKPVAAQVPLAAIPAGPTAVRPEPQSYPIQTPGAQGLPVAGGWPPMPVSAPPVSRAASAKPMQTEPPLVGAQASAATIREVAGNKADKPAGSLPTRAAQAASLLPKQPAGASEELAISNPRWSLVPLSGVGDKNLRAVFFINETTGWAAGDAGALFRTVDGGAHWLPLACPLVPGAVLDLKRIQFADINNGWMLGEVRSPQRDVTQTVLLITNDGGTIWQQQPMRGVLNFYFADAKTGWAVGKNATLLKTVDGGMHWKPAEQVGQLVGLPVESSAYAFGFSDVYFINSQIGWALGNFYGRARSNIGGLFYTSDGGESWQRVPLAVQSRQNTARFTQGALHQVRFADLQTGVITGEMDDGDEHFFFTLQTSDGGQTWRQTRTPSHSLHQTQFLDASNGWTAAAAARPGSAAAVVYDTSLLRTEDAGKSWTADFLARSNQIRGLFFLSANKGWAVGERGVVLRYEGGAGGK